MKIKELLTGREVLTLGEKASVLEAARAMSAKKVGAVLVTGADGRLAGIFTERDLMSRVVVARLDPEKATLREVMTPDVFSVGPDREVADVQSELQRRPIRHIPVVVDGRVVGILSVRDLLRSDVDQMSHKVEALENYFLGGPEIR
jgi:signal-transduction protein with cAMP-binding, CBS, and nucleotidyltransferase domain